MRIKYFLVIFCLLSFILGTCGQTKAIAGEISIIDNAAKEILRKTALSYKELQTYCEEAITNAVVKMDSMEMKMDMGTKLVVKRPNKMVYEMKGGTIMGMSMETSIVSDGQTLWLYLGMLNQYIKEKAPQNLWDMDLTKSLGRAAGMSEMPFGLPSGLEKWGPSIHAFLLNREPERAILDNLVGAIIAGEEKMDSVDTNILEVDFKPPPMPLVSLKKPLKFKLWIGKQDNLIYKTYVDMSEMMEEMMKTVPMPEGMKKPKMSIEVTEIKTNIKLNEEIPDAEFAFKPPEGAKLVKSFEFAGMPGAEKPSKWLGKKAYSFKLYSLDRKLVSLDQFRGKVVLIDFWATWCGPCVEELPHIEKIYRDLKAKGLVVLGINDERDVNKVRAFLKEKNITFPTLWDSQGKVAKAYGVDAIPRVLIIDKKGIVRADFVGLQPEETIREELKKLGIK